MKKKLIFNFYVFPDWLNGEVGKINEIHLRCLKEYIHIFDEVMFVITMDDTNNIKLINEVKGKILDFFIKGQITIRIEKNTKLREAVTFYKEVVKKLGEDDLVFFAHNKGITNIKKDNKESIYYWIYGMYFYCLNFIDDVESALIGDNGISYGAFFAQCKLNKCIKYGWMYSGNFYWLNSKKVKNYMDNNNIAVPPLDNRMYGEQFIGNIVAMFNPQPFPTTYGKWGFDIDVYNPYCQSKEILKVLYENIDDLEDFINKIGIR